jgi:hypothetical protein
VEESEEFDGVLWDNNFTAYKGELNPLRSPFRTGNYLGMGVVCITKQTTPLTKGLTNATGHPEFKILYGNVAAVNIYVKTRYSEVRYLGKTSAF